MTPMTPMTPMSPMNPYYCPALWVLRGTTYTQDAAGRLTPRDPEHRIDPATGRCTYCHTTLAKAKKESIVPPDTYMLRPRDGRE